MRIYWCLSVPLAVTPLSGGRSTDQLYTNGTVSLGGLHLVWCQVGQDLSPCRSVITSKAKQSGVGLPRLDGFAALLRAIVTHVFHLFRAFFPSD
jgi:hypothetical protein